MAITISLCMIVKNEEANLARCLKSVRGVFDEINIVDTGSTDRTVEIAREFTDRVFHFEWINDFAAARNFSFSKATMDYIFWLDADDVVTTMNRFKLLELKRTLKPQIEFVSMLYEYAYDEKGRSIMTQSRERLVKRSCNMQWKNPLHETIDITNFLGTMVEIHISHKHNNKARSAERNTPIITELHETGEKTARNLYYYALETSSNGKDEEALASFREFFALPMDAGNPFDPTSAYISCATLYIKRGEVEEAYELLMSQKEQLADKAEYYCTLALYHTAKNDTESVKSCCEKALACKGGYFFGNMRVFDHRLEAYYYFIPNEILGRLYLKENNYEKALEHYEAAVRYRDTDPQVVALADKLRRLHTLQKEEEKE